MSTTPDLWQSASEMPDTFNASDFFVERHIREGRADKTAIIDQYGETSYGQLAERVGRATMAMSSLGLRQEDRVAMIMLDSREFHTVFWGAIKAGVVPVALNTLLVTDNYEYILNDCRARVLFVSAALLPVVEPILDRLPLLEKVIVDGDAGGAHGSLDQLLEPLEPTTDCAATQRDEVAFWLYSSGSTGNPKGVMHRHSSLYMTGLHYGRGVLDIDESAIVYSAAKLFFAYGLGNAMTFPMFVGATAVLLAGRPTPDSVMDTLKAHQATIFFGVPTLYAAILADPAHTPDSGSQQMQLCVSAGEALPGDIAKRWQERFGCEILDGVGSTEMLHIYLSNRRGEVRANSSGTAVPGYTLELCDESGASVPHGEIGELVVQGESAATGYWNLRAKSVNTFAGKDTWTGDKYYRDEQGYYVYCGRTDDMFKSGGNWVSPFEVESALIGHDAVLEAAVVPRADESGNEKPFAYVVLNPSVDASDALADELKRYVKQHIELWKHPRWIEFTDDLPKTATGKIQRFKLRA